MASDDIEGSDLRDLLNKFKKKPVMNGETSRERRQKAERKAMMSPTDGRRRRGGVVRDAQLNFKVPSAVKQRVIDIADKMDIAMVDVLERGLALLEAEYEDAQGVN
jgi:hypothetical protein